jgi:ABC-type glycerol-3-phosphate transport system substrate-binding protein
MNKIWSRRAFLKSAALGLGAAVLAACQPKVVEVTKLVTEKEVVKETVIVEGAAKEVTKVVEKEVQKIVTATPAPAGPVEILHYDRNIPQDVDFRNELAKRFTEQNPNITVKIEVMPDDYQAGLLARIASGTAGDCFRYGTHYGLANLALRGIFYELDDFAAKDSYDLNAYFKGAMDACRVEGKNLSVNELLWVSPSRRTSGPTTT